MKWHGWKYTTYTLSHTTQHTPCASGCLRRRYSLVHLKTRIPAMQSQTFRHGSRALFQKCTCIFWCICVQETESIYRQSVARAQREREREREGELKHYRQTQICPQEPQCTMTCFMNIQVSWIINSNSLEKLRKCTTGSVILYRKRSITEPVSV